MIIRYLLVILLTLATIFLYQYNKYLDTQNHAVNKEINKYSKMIIELKKIEQINQKISNLNIPLLSQNDAKEIILNKIDSLQQTLPAEVKSFNDLNGTIKAELFIYSDITSEKQKEELINMFKTTLPAITFEYFDLLKHNVKSTFYFAVPYKDENESE